MPKDGLGHRCIPKCSAIALPGGDFDTPARWDYLSEALEHLERLVVSLGGGLGAGAVASVPGAGFPPVIPDGEDDDGKNKEDEDAQQDD